MTSAEFEISELDKSLAEDGEDIILRRVVGSSATTQQFIDVTCRAFVRGYQPIELVGGITQTDFNVILSPTQIDRASWPGGQTSSGGTDPRVPRKGDKARVRGAWRSVETAAGIPIGDTLVRIEMRVLG